MRFGIAVFPGTWSERDCAHAVSLDGHEAVMRNASLEFRCEPSWLRVETEASPFTAGCRRGDVLRIPVSHGEGRYVADPQTLLTLENEERVALRYVRADGGPVGEDSPNGS